MLCATYVDDAGKSLCIEGSTLEPANTCGDDDVCSQSECCVDGETWDIVPISFSAAWSRHQLPTWGGSLSTVPVQTPQAGGLAL